MLMKQDIYEQPHFTFHQTQVFSNVLDMSLIVYKDSYLLYGYNVLIALVYSNPFLSY